MPALHTLLVAADAASYDGEARRLVRMGRVAVDGVPACDEEAVVERGSVTVLDPEAVTYEISFLADGCSVVVGPKHLCPAFRTVVIGTGHGVSSAEAQVLGEARP